MSTVPVTTSTAAARPAILPLLDAIPDPRQPGKTLYPLPTILFIALAGTLAGMNGWTELAEFARRRRAWLARYVDVAAGLPDDEVLRRVLSTLAPTAFEDLLRAWTAQLAAALGADVHLDGKTLRGAVRRGGGLHLLHVWASKYGVLLAHRAVDGAPGEAPAAAALLALLDVRGATVSGDANFCTQANTAAVRDAHAHYLLALKGNRSALHDRVCAAFGAPARLRARGVAVDRHVAVSHGHGRRERRTVWAVEAAAAGVDTTGWRDLRTLVRVRREVWRGAAWSEEVHYYMTSRAPDARALGRLIRRHWRVENDCHWQLDVAFDEDRCAVRDANGALALATLRRIALMMVKRDTTLKTGLAIRVKMAGVDPDYLAHLLTLGIDS